MPWYDDKQLQTLDKDIYDVKVQSINTYSTSLHLYTYTHVWFHG